MTKMQTFCIIFIFQLLSLTGATQSGIVGGKVAKAHSRPYMASLQINGRHTCGGVLICDDYVLTTAHCKPQDNDHITVVLGAHNITQKENTQQRIPVGEYYPYPCYSGHDHDIMLLKLKEKATLNKNVKVIALPKEEKKIKALVKCDVAGWGRTQNKGSSSDVLKETTEQIQFNVECSTKWNEHFKSNRMICTKFDKKTGGICQGDSGGPLICNKKLLGLTAFTENNDCNDPKFPHVFTKISYYLPWIKSVIEY